MRRLKAEDRSGRDEGQGGAGIGPHGDPGGQAALVLARWATATASDAPDVGPHADPEHAIDRRVHRLLAMAEVLSPDQRMRLASAAPFRDLDPEALDDLAVSMHSVNLQAGDVLVRQGEAGDRLFVVLDGVLEAVLERPGSPDQSLAEHGPGDIVGELALLTGGIRLATVRAASAATVAVLPRDAFDDLLDRSPSIAITLAELGARRFRRSQLAIYLSRLFGLVDPTILDDVEDAVDFVGLRSGEVLVRQGEPGDAMYIVLGGRLRVVAEVDGEERVLNDIGRGETVGEIALLTESARSATVYAVRDSELARVSAASFERLTQRYPEVMLQVTRVLGARLQQISASTKTRVAPARTIVLVPASAALDVSAIAEPLARAMRSHGTTLLVTRQDVERSIGGVLHDGVHEHHSHEHPARLRLSRWLDEHEAANDFVVCVADPVVSAWTEVAIARADHLVFVADSTADPAPGEIERGTMTARPPRLSPRRTLLLVHPPRTARPRRTARWLAARSVDDHLHLRHDSQADIDRVARILAGRAVTLVLGGGGARGFAHVGVLRAFEELGIPIDMIGGTSMGAAMAATWAMGWNSATILARSRELFAGLFDVTLPIVSVLAGGRIERSLKRAFGDREIEDLWVTYFSVASNLTRAEQVVDRRGPVREAVRASISLPGVMPPVYRRGDLLVDGGLLNNVPVDVMRSLNEGGRVVAVDVSPAVDLAAKAPFEPTLSGWRLLANRLNPLGKSVAVPSIVDLLNRSAVLGSVFLRNQARTARTADLYLQLPSEQWALLDFRHSAAIARQGYERAIGGLREWWTAEGG